MDDIKRCSKCGISKMKTDFQFRSTNQKYRSECIQCESIRQIEWRDKNREKIKNHKKQYYEDREKIRNQHKKYYDDNRDVIIKQKNKYEKSRYKADVNFRLIKNIRRRIHHALNGKSKSISTKEILGVDIDLYRKWTEFQFTTEMKWSNIEIDHVKPICLFDVTKDEELKQAFNWRNTQPLLKHDQQKKGIKFNFLDYQLQFIKAYQFIELKEERFNEEFH